MKTGYLAFCALQRIASVWLVAVLFFSTLNSAMAEDKSSERSARPRLADADGTVVLPPMSERFSYPKGKDIEKAEETPDFQKHVSPLFGRLGCNGRACHGSFQGQGGFQLSLFGYDFAEDYKALTEDGAGRVDLEDGVESLILSLPVDEDSHGGGKRFEEGGWEYWVLRHWIESGATPVQEPQKLVRLEVTPQEILFAPMSPVGGVKVTATSVAGENRSEQQLRVIAHWEDGSSEDVTCVSRFSTNNESIAAIDDDGIVSAGEVGDTHVVVSYDKAVVPIPVLRPATEAYGGNYLAVANSTQVDELIAQKLKKLGIVPSAVCRDEEFLRRASLDVTGTLPSPTEVQSFLAEDAPDKRARKIDELLSRPSYAARWTTFFCDVTGNNDDQLRNFMPQSVNPSSQWYQWIYKRLEENLPYDELVEGIVVANSRREGESYREYCEEMSEICRDTSGESFAGRPGLVYYWARNNFRTPEDRAIGFAYSFLGVRIQCAQCHKHPFDQWSKDDFDQFERLFATVQARANTMSPDAKPQYQEMVSALNVNKKLKGNQLRRELGQLLKKGEVVPLPELVVAKPRVRRVNNKKVVPAAAKLLGGDMVEMAAGDVRDDLMDWLRDADNPYFAKAIVNRVWAEYFGVGIVDPVDDLNLANAPSNAALFEYLAAGFRENDFDLKWLHREILNSDAYQRSWQSNETNSKDQHNFSHASLRRLSAEATYDAVRVALAGDAYAKRARDLEIETAMTKPGSSARANRQDDQSYALRVFGRSVRESNCDCDRSSEPSLLQTVYLANDASIQKWLRDPRQSWVAQVCKKYDWPLPNEKSSPKLSSEQIEKFTKRVETQLQDAAVKLARIKTTGNQKALKAAQKRRFDFLRRVRKEAKSRGLESHLEELLEGHSQGSKDRTESASRVATTQSPEAVITLEQAKWITDNAYLRTLSRKPTEQEQSTVIAYLTEEENPALATEGLLWSLVNTKEFILNH